jgi:hypothetical protein
LLPSDMIAVTRRTLQVSLPITFYVYIYLLLLF